MMEKVRLLKQKNQQTKNVHLMKGIFSIISILGEHGGNVSKGEQQSQSQSFKNQNYKMNIFFICPCLKWGHTICQPYPTGSGI